MTQYYFDKKSGPTFAVLGVGAVGGLYGGLLARAGYEVHFLARSDFDQLSATGLNIESPLGNFQINPSVYSSVHSMPQVDCVIVSWKTTANENLPRLLEHFKSSKPVVLVLQNGLNVEASAASVVGAESVFGGCCFLCCNRIGPGQIKHLDYGRIAIGAYAGSVTEQASSTNSPGRSLPAEMLSVVDALRQTGIEIQVADSLAEIRWKKLAWNIPYNGLSVVLNADTAEIMNEPQACKLAEELMEEVAASAKACGISVGRDHIEKMLADTRVMVPYASSMLLDFQNGRPMEVEAIFGNPLREAQAAGFHPRKIEMLYRQLKFIDSRATAMSITRSRTV
ncbi:MAG: 2-dehydropantoate 2-reductase [Pirellulales bacterium]